MDNKLIRLLLMYTKFLFLSFQEHFKIIVTLMILFLLYSKILQITFWSHWLWFTNLHQSKLHSNMILIENEVWKSICWVVYLNNNAHHLHWWRVMHNILKKIKLDFIWTHYGEFEWAINAHKHILFLTLCAWYWLKIPAKIHFICLMFCLILS